MTQSETPEAIARDVAAVGRLDAVPTILRVVSQVTGMRFAAVARVSDTSWTTCAVHDGLAFGLRPGDSLELSTTLCTEVRQQMQAVVIEHVGEDPVYCNHHTPRMYRFESYISVPIVLEDGDYFGNLCALDPLPRSLVQTEALPMFELFAQLIATQLVAERRLEAAGEALVDARATAELREQFIAVLGHDLRNPLSTAAAIGELLKRSAPGLPLPQLGERLLGSTGRMSSLIDDVLDFARGRLGAGMQLRLVREEHVVVRLAQVIAELQLTHPDRGLQWRPDITRPVLCDAERVQQLLSNLVKNALTHGQPREPVSVAAYTEGGELVLDVHNHGVPIAPEHLGRVFEPYWRSNAGREQGLGLGLYICSEIVRAHGGTLAVTSTAEAGTRFIARLPAG